MIDSPKSGNTEIVTDKPHHDKETITENTQKKK